MVTSEGTVKRPDMLRPRVCNGPIHCAYCNGLVTKPTREESISGMCEGCLDPTGATQCAA